MKWTRHTIPVQNAHALYIQQPRGNLWGLRARACVRERLMTGKCHLTHTNRFNCIKLMGRKWYAALAQRVRSSRTHNSTLLHLTLAIDAIVTAQCIWPLYGRRCESRIRYYKERKLKKKKVKMAKSGKNMETWKQFQCIYLVRVCVCVLYGVLQHSATYCNLRRNSSKELKVLHTLHRHTIRPSIHPSNGWHPYSTQRNSYILARNTKRHSQSCNTVIIKYCNNL